MQQRVGVVRPGQQPDVLLMDEPFASVDAQTRMTLQEELNRIWEERRPTVVFITHDVAGPSSGEQGGGAGTGRLLAEVEFPERPRNWDRLVRDDLQGLSNRVRSWCAPHDLLRRLLRSTKGRSRWPYCWERSPSGLAYRPPKDRAGHRGRQAAGGRWSPSLSGTLSHPETTGTAVFPARQKLVQLRGVNRAALTSVARPTGSSRSHRSNRE